MSIAPAKAGPPKRWLALLWPVVLAYAITAGPVSAQPTRPPARIGVVDLDRLVLESPQAEKAKKRMANRFAERKQALEKTSRDLQSELGRLKNHANDMSRAKRQDLRSQIRDDQHRLQRKQSRYNGDVSDAEQKELDRVRSRLRQVIDAYAKAHGFDLILGHSVVYADDSVDITGAILQRLKHDKEPKAKS